MRLQATCPSCGRVYPIDESQLGASVRCTNCRSHFTLSISTADTVAPLEAIVVDETVRIAEQVGGEKLPRTLGRFELLKRVGHGSFGTVYRAADRILKREVALKLPHPASLLKSGTVERFLREAQTAAQLWHPSIVPVYDYGEVEGRVYIASAYIRGRTLEMVLKYDRPDAPTAARWLLKMAEALAYAHRFGIVHRDVKPANMMLSDDGEPYLTDFGIAQWDRDAQTNEKGALGTPLYMSPEQAGRAGAAVGPASDQYALGVVMYELLCGRTPFVPAGSIEQLLFQIRDAAPPAPSSVVPGVSRDLEAICLRALAKAPAERFADCQELADELRRALADEPVRSRPMGPVERTVRWCRRRPAMAGLIGSVAALVVLTGVVSFVAYVQTSRALTVADDQRARAESALEQEEVARQHAQDEQRKAEEAQHRAETAAKNESLALEKEAEARKVSEQRAKDLEVANAEIVGSRNLLAERATDLEKANAALNAKTQELAQTLNDLQRETSRAAREAKLAEMQAYISQLVKVYAAVSTGVPTRLNSVAGNLLDQCPAPLRDWEHQHLSWLAGKSKGYLKEAQTGSEPAVKPIWWRHGRSADRALCYLDKPTATGITGWCVYDHAKKEYAALDNPSNADARLITSRMAITPDGKYVLGPTLGNEVFVLWDAATGEVVRQLKGRAGLVNGIAFSPDGRDALVTEVDAASLGGRRRVGQIWSLETGDVAAELKTGEAQGLIAGLFGPPTQVRYAPGIVTSNHAAYAADGLRVVTLQTDGRLTLWDAASGKQVAELAPRERAVVGGGLSGSAVMTVSGDGKLVARVTFIPNWQEKVLVVPDDAAEGSEAPTAPPSRTTPPLPGAPPTPKPTPKPFAAPNQPAGPPQPIEKIEIGHGYEIQIVDALSGAVVTEYAARSIGSNSALKGFGSAVFSPSGRRVLGIGAESICVWDVETGVMLAMFAQLSNQFVGTWKFLPDGALIVDPY